MAPKRKSKTEEEPEQEQPEEQKKEKSGQQGKKGAGKASGKGSKASSAQAEEKPASKRTKKAKESDTGDKKKDESEAAEQSKGKEEAPNRVDHVTDPKETPKGVERDNRGRLVFEGHPEFRPTLTPKQVIQAGSFGGIYFNPKGGKKSSIFPDGVPISADDFPKDWFEGLSDEQYKGTRYNIKLNKYKVKSGQNQSQWEEQGWIKKDSIDKRGWFQWYCHFTLGRRTDDDERQISRWTGVAGPKGRWKTRLVNLVKQKNGDVDDASISPVVRQNLLHWAYELVQPDYEALARGER